MRFRLPAALAATLLLGLPAVAQDTTADTVVATVNGTDITVGHMIVARARLPEQYQQLPPDVLFDGVLEQLIRQAAVASGAAEPSKQVELILENERRSLLVNETLQEVASAALTEQALQQAYEETYAGAEPQTEYNAAHILVETEEEAQALKDELESGAEFAALAREHSTGPSGASGGDLGWFGEGMMVAEFEDAVMALEPGQVSDPVQTQFGWHLVRLNETRQKDAPTLDEVRDELVDTVQQQAIEARIEEATEAAEITRADLEEIDPAVLNDFGLLDE